MKRGHPLSAEFMERIRSYTAGPKCELALAAGLSPCTLTAWGRGTYRPLLNDERALKLASILGVPASAVFLITTTAGKAHGNPEQLAGAVGEDPTLSRSTREVEARAEGTGPQQEPSPGQAVAKGMTNGKHQGQAHIQAQDKRRTGRQE